MFFGSAEMSGKLSVSIKTGQQLLATLLPKKDSKGKGAASALAAPSAKAKSAEPLMLAFSKDALKLMEEKQEKARQAQEKMEESRAQKSTFEETAKTAKKNALAAKIGELRRQLHTLLERMKTAFLMGDKRSAIAIAKEAASLAKQLAAALKASKGADASTSAEGVSVPSLSTAGGAEEEGGEAESAEAAEAAEATEAVEKAERVNPEKAAAGAEKAVEDAKKQEDAENKKNKENKDRADDLKEIGKEVASRAKSGNLKTGTGKDIIDEAVIIEIIGQLRAIMSMARATLKQKSLIGGDAPKNPLEEMNMETQLDKAVKEIEDAIDEIADC
jgi:hypothetical protein